MPCERIGNARAVQCMEFCHMIENRDRDRDMWTQQGEWSVEHGLWMGEEGRVEDEKRKERGKKGEGGRY